MARTPIQLAAAAAVAGVLGVGGVSLASAQEDTTTTTEDTSATTDDTASDGSTEGDREDCPHGDGSSTEDGSADDTSGS